MISGRPRLILLVVLGISLSGLAAFWVHENELAAHRREFERRSLARHQFLAAHFEAYENVLFALRLLVENNEVLEPHEFERAAASLQQRAPGILALQWVPVVAAADLPAYSARARALLGPSFALQELRPDNTLAALDESSARDRHAIISYTYPTSGNETALGYDIFTAPTAPDLLRAFETRLPALTRALNLVQGDHGVILTAYADRPASPRGPPLTGPGFVQVVVRINPMLRQLWSIGGADGIDFALYDITDQERTPLYAERADEERPILPPPPYEQVVSAHTITQDLPIGGRLWRACYNPGADWMAGYRGDFSLVVLVGGILLTLTFAAFLDQLRRRTQAIQHEVRLRTAELNENRAILDGVIEHSSSAIWVKDARLRFFLVNEEFCRIRGRSRAELLGQTETGHDLTAATLAETERADREILATGRPLRYEETCDIGGRQLTYLIGKFLLRHADGSVYAIGGIATDITALRQAETEKNAMERRLLETQKLESLGILAGGIAHDFNNLLTGILGHASLLAATLPPAAGAHASLAQIEGAARRAADLCRHMLAYSGRGRYVLEAVELGALAREVFPLVQPSLGKNIRVRQDLAPELPWVTADVSQLRQVIMNLVVNASEAMAGHGGDIVVRTRAIHADSRLFATCVHSPSLPAGTYVVLEISDTGSGMDEETLARIFDPFFTTKFAGRGLGLAAVLGIVRGHQGAIRVTTRPDQGTAFQLYLPASTKKSNVAAPTIADTPPAASARLLLVDDEATVREITTHLLDAIGYRTTAVSGGQEAVNAFRIAPQGFDAVLLDLTMPGMSGGEAMNEIRKLRSDIPIILMSGYSEHDAADLLSAPRTAFLAKPFTLESLRTHLAALLSAR